MPDVSLEQEFKLDLIPQSEPALSAKSDMPVIETKPDSQPADKPKAEAAPDKEVEGKKPAESAPAEEPEDPAAEASPKPAKGVQKRIDELVRQREDAERRADAERQEKLRLLALVEKGPKPEPKSEPEEDPEPQRPTREAFADATAYEEALANYADQKASWSAKRAVKEALAEQEQKVEQRQRDEAQKAAIEAYTTRVQKASEKYPDYKQVAESPDVSVSIPMAHAIMHSEHGPEIAYHLGKNPEEAKRISALQPALQLVELGLLVAKLTTPAPKEETPSPQPVKPVSAAPKPIKPLGPSSEKPNKDPSEMSMDEYADYARKRDAAATRRSGART
jgi:hypothetical protein